MMNQRDVRLQLDATTSQSQRSASWKANNNEQFQSVFCRVSLGLGEQLLTKRSPLAIDDGSISMDFTAINDVQRSNKSVGFSSSANMRYVLIDPIDYHKLYYNQNEIKAMRSSAMNKNSQLRHSMTTQPQQDLVSLLLQLHDNESTTCSGTTLGGSSAQPIPPLVHTSRRTHSAASQMNSLRRSTKLDPKETRYVWIAELDKEVFISMEYRRNSTRRRLNHYAAVFDEQYRQVAAGYTKINTLELASACVKTSEVAIDHALNTARKDETLANAILLGERLKCVLR